MVLDAEGRYFGLAFWHWGGSLLQWNILFGDEKDEVVGMSPMLGFSGFNPGDWLPWKGSSKSNVKL